MLTAAKETATERGNLSHGEAGSSLATQPFMLVATGFAADLPDTRIRSTRRFFLMLLTFLISMQCNRFRGIPT
uniref:Uncharacterized protein n=1 Tax=Paraburkholderia sprentiae WSM5005 TaxID=754502 RepID=A0A1I9YFF0_9BURK